MKGIVRSIGEEGLTKLCLHICEEGLRLSEESSHALNKPISTWNMILDLGKYLLSGRGLLLFKLSIMVSRFNLQKTEMNFIKKTELRSRNCFE